MRPVNLFLMCIVLLACMNVAGERLVVPEDYDSIQAAIDAAAPGDIVEVGPGIYEENLAIRKEIDLKGAGAENTIIRSESTKRELLLVRGADTGSISGFRFELFRCGFS